MTEFIGHFHPVIVHLPIGILLVALLLLWLSHQEKYAGVKTAVPIVLLFGSITAIIACVTGYLLSINDSYDQSLINWHMWLAIAVVLVSLVLYTKVVNPKVEASSKLLSFALLASITATGHFGGSLTHGSDYLTKPLLKLFSTDTVSAVPIKPLANVQEAFVYNDVVRPILQSRCYSCHNRNKQKGKLRMDNVELLLKGGKHGSIINVNNVDSSQLLQRVLLPVDDDHHMPPKEKPQLTENQISLLHWWIVNQADFKKKVRDLDQPEKIKPALLALQRPVINKKITAFLPESAVEEADEQTLEKLRKKGFLVLPVAQNTNYLRATISGDFSVSKQDLELLSRLSKQLISLTLNNPTVDDQQLSIISQLVNLRKLNLSQTGITDQTIALLNKMPELQYLNLVGTKATAKGISELGNLKKLNSLFLYRTNVAAADVKKLQKIFPGVEIDIGNYQVPFFPTDTTLVKQTNK